MHYALSTLRTLTVEVAAATTALREAEKKLTDTQLELVAACRPAILAAIGAYNAEDGIEFTINPRVVAITFNLEKEAVDLGVRFLGEPNEELSGYEVERVRNRLASHVASACERAGIPLTLGTLSVPISYFSK